MIAGVGQRLQIQHKSYTAIQVYKVLSFLVNWAPCCGIFGKIISAEM